MPTKNSAQTRRGRSRETSDPLPLASPIYAAVERPVTTEQLAAHLQVTTRTIANYRLLGVIPFWRVTARRVLYRISDVERALAANNQ